MKPPLLPPKRTRINSFNRKSNYNTSEQCPKILTENRFESLKTHPNVVDSKTTENSKVISDISESLINNFNEIIHKNSIESRSDNSCIDNCKQDTSENQVVLRHKQYKVLIFSIMSFNYLTHDYFFVMRSLHPQYKISLKKLTYASIWF